MTKSTRTQGGESLRKSLNLLNIIGKAEHDLSLKDLVERTGLTKPTVYRMISVLTEEGFVTHNPVTKALALGPTLLSLAQKTWSDGDLRDSAVRLFPEVVGPRSVVMLMVRSNGHMTCVEMAKGSAASTDWRVGKTAPVTHHIAGEAMLAFENWGQIDSSLLELEPDISAGEREKLKNRLSAARSRFYASQSIGSDVAVAAPVFDFSGRPIAAIALVDEAPSEKASSIHLLGAKVVQLARKISSLRGGYPFGLNVPEGASSEPQSNVELLEDTRCLIGDSPHFDADANTLTWIDILAPSVHRLDMDTRAHIEKPLPEIVGAAVPTSNGGLIIADRSGFRILDKSLSERDRIKFDGLPAGFRFNDGRQAPDDSFWFGAMDMATSRGTGQLLRFERLDAEPQILPGFSLPNGIVFHPDTQRMYVIDSMEKWLCELDWDDRTGEARTLNRFPLLHDLPGRPSGLAITGGGDLLTCHWDGGMVLRMSTDGEIKQKYPVPIPRPSGIWSDTEDRVAYITSARVRLSQEDVDRYPLSGAVFQLNLDG